MTQYRCRMCRAYMSEQSWSKADRELYTSKTINLMAVRCPNCGAVPSMEVVKQ